MREICKNGFTLLEILVALFIFSILSLLLATGLRSVINAQSGSETKAERLRDLQHTLLIISRDVEQTVDRSVRVASGSEEKAFVGTPTGFTFTHTGFANPTGMTRHSALQRARYFYSDKTLWRSTWPVLDQAPQTVAQSRRLLTHLDEVNFQYLDQENHFQNNWPVEGRDAKLLPRAVKISLTISHWGEITQIYLIPIQVQEKKEPEKHESEKKDTKPESPQS